MKYLSIIQALSKGLLYPQVKCTWIFHEGQILCPSTKQIVWQSSFKSLQITTTSNNIIYSNRDSRLHGHINWVRMYDNMYTYIIYKYKYTYDTDTYIYIYRYIYIHITCIYTNIHLRHCFFCCLESPKYRYYTSVCLDMCAMKSPCLASCLPSIKQVWNDQYSQPQNPRNRTWCAYIAHKTNLQVHVHITCV